MKSLIIVVSFFIFCHTLCRANECSEVLDPKETAIVGISKLIFEYAEVSESTALKILLKNSIAEKIREYERNFQEVFHLNKNVQKIDFQAPVQILADLGLISVKPKFSVAYQGFGKLAWQSKVNWAKDEKFVRVQDANENKVINLETGDSFNLDPDTYAMSKEGHILAIHKRENGKDITYFENIDTNEKYGSFEGRLCFEGSTAKDFNDQFAILRNSRTKHSHLKVALVENYTIVNFKTGHSTQIGMSRGYRRSQDLRVFARANNETIEVVDSATGRILKSYVTEPSKFSDLFSYPHDAFFRKENKKLILVRLSDLQEFSLGSEENLLALPELSHDGTTVVIKSALGYRIEKLDGTKFIEITDGALHSTMNTQQTTIALWGDSTTVIDLDTLEVNTLPMRLNHFSKNGEWLYSLETPNDAYKYVLYHPKTQKTHSLILDHKIELINNQFAITRDSKQVYLNYIEELQESDTQLPIGFTHSAFSASGEYLIAGEKADATSIVVYRLKQ